MYNSFNIKVSVKMYRITDQDHIVISTLIGMLRSAINTKQYMLSWPAHTLDIETHKKSIKIEINTQKYLSIHIDNPDIKTGTPSSIFPCLILFIKPHLPKL